MCFGITGQTSQVAFHWNTRIQDSETNCCLPADLWGPSPLAAHYVPIPSAAFLSLSIQHTFFPQSPIFPECFPIPSTWLPFGLRISVQNKGLSAFLVTARKKPNPQVRATGQDRTGQISGTHQPQWAPHCPSILLHHLLWYHPTPYNDYFKPSAFSEPPAKSSFTSLPFNRYAELQLFRENQISQMGTTSTFTLFLQIYLYTYPPCLLLLSFWGPNPSVVLLVSSPPLPSTSKETYYKFPLLSGVYSTVPWTLYPIFQYGAAPAEYNKKYIHFPTTPYLFFLTFLLEGFIYTVYCLLPFLFKPQTIPVKIQPPSPWI